MCLIAVAWRWHPKYDLILAANRDEFHARPTESAHAWPEAPAVFAGRDRQAGGTWCGVNADGRFAAVTNVREPDPPAPGQRSRGALVAEYLLGEQDARAYCEAVLPRRREYGGFNLLAGDAESFLYLGNRDDRGIVPLAPGVHALSNGSLGDVWPKTRRFEERLREVVDRADVDPQVLLDLLADDTPAEDALPETGVGAEMEYFLSPIFIRGTQYGTRASTVVLRDTAGRLRFVEQNYGPAGAKGPQVDRTLQVRPA